MKITTNHVPRDILDASELTPRERKDASYYDWDALDAGTDSASFFRYKGSLYDLAEFTLTESRGELDAAGWHGYSADSFFSGIVVKIVDEDRVIVGRALS